MAKLSHLERVDNECSTRFRERLEHFTWAWFTLPLSTAGIALLLATTPHRFTGLTTIGKMFFIFALVLYILSITAIVARFIIHPHTFRCSLVHPHEALFFPTTLLGLANLIACAQIYGSPYCGAWFTTTIQALFWMYMAVAFVASVLQYLFLFTAPATRLTIQGMTPAWILPVFPILFGGVLASVVAPGQSPMTCLTIVICGITFLGIGWMVAFLMYAVFLHRLMEFGLPPPNLRPGMFISVGPPGFTGLALIGFGKALTLVVDQGYFTGNGQAVEVLQTVANFTAVFLWAFGFWFFCISLIAVLAGVKQMSFHLIWWGLVFPNIAFAIATGRIGEQLKSEGIMWVGSLMAILLVGTWIFVIIMNVLAVLRREIMMPGMDEDKECHKDHKLLSPNILGTTARSKNSRNESGVPDVLPAKHD